MRERWARARSVAVRVLVAGPMDDSGGLSRMARMTAAGFDAADAEVHAFDSAKDTPHDRSMLVAMGSHVRRAWRFGRAVSRHKPQLVHLHTCSYGTFERTVIDCVICAALKRAYVLHIHGGLFDQYIDGLSGWRRRMVVWALRRAVRVIVVGDVWRQSLSQRISGLDIDVLHNALERDDESPCAVAIDKPRCGGVLFAGDLSEVKRPEDLIVAYAALPMKQRRAFPLTIVGGGDPRREALIKRMAADIAPGDPIRFAGKVDGPTVRKLMADADLFVIPSRAEGLPLVLLEAMRAGAAIVVTDVGAVREVVTNGVEAMIVKQHDPEQLALTIKRLLSDEARRTTLSAAARIRSEQFDAQTFRSRLLNIWREAATEAAPSTPPPLPRLASPTFRSIL